jgi:DNA-binding NarL/FixJ family response regulator
LASIELNGPLKIIVTAPFPAIRAGLRSLCELDSRIEILAECNSPAEWAPFVDAAQAFLIAPIGGISQEFWHSVENQARGVPVLFLLSQPLGFFPSLTGSLWGVLSFTSSSDELILALRTCAAGYWVAQPNLLPDPNAFKPLVESLESDEPLTNRETEILQYLAQGFSNKQIAHEMKISAHTVKFHITSIYSKLGVNNRTEATRQGLRRGWINL